MAEIQPLLQACAALRARWPEDWPGLPRVLLGCLTWLVGAAPGPRRSPAAPVGAQAAAQAVTQPSTARVPQGHPNHPNHPTQHSQRLQAQALEAARIVERAGARRARQGQEPAYHNRLHIADTLVGMTALLRARRDLQRLRESSGSDQLPVQPAELMCLLAMLIHDFEHTGRINESPGDIERHSLHRFLPHAMAIGLSLDDWALLSRLVLHTDPALVGPLHDEFRAAPPQTDAPLSWPETAVLVTEADVLASVLPGIGHGLGEALQREWTPHYPDRAQRVVTPEGRLGFLALGARFSSPAAARLGAVSVVQAQVAELSRLIQPVKRTPARI